MKKLRFIVAISLMLVAMSIQSQSFTPAQIKDARWEIYKWIDSYVSQSMFLYNNVDDHQYSSLFKDENVKIVNDFLPTSDDQLISVHDYTTLLTTYVDVFKFNVSIDTVRVISQQCDERGYYCIVNVGRKITCSLMLNSDYFYPCKYYNAILALEYNWDTRNVTCTRINRDNKLKVHYVYHNDTTSIDNMYISDEDIPILFNIDELPIIDSHIEHLPSDTHFIYMAKDTMKYNVHIGGSFVMSFGQMDWYSPMTKLVNNYGNDYSLSAGAFFQLGKIKRNHRWGLEITPTFARHSITFGGNYEDSYLDLDPDNFDYERRISVSNYTEQLSLLSLSLPLGFRYDKFFKEQKNLSFFMRMGALLSCDVKGYGKISASSAYYSGYYKELFDVVIDQNGIYDFGQYSINSKIVKELYVNPLGIGGYAGVGLQYFITPAFAIEAAMQYGIKYHFVSRPDDYHLTETSEIWSSATGLFRSYFEHNLSFNVAVNINF